MKYVLSYLPAGDPSPDALAAARQHFPAHQALFVDYHTRGLLLMIGTFEHRQTDGAMAIFTTREAAESFARDDPFVVNGVVGRWVIRGWNEVLAT